MSSLERQVKLRINFFYLYPTKVPKHAMLDAKDIFGWENWLQMELLYLMSTQDPGGEYWVEDSMSIDRRSFKGRSGKSDARVDLAYRRINEERGVYNAIELKLKKTPAALVTGMLRDLDRLASVRPNQFNFRSITSIGLCPGQVAPLSKWLKVATDVNKENLDNGCPRGFGKYRLVILHWESGRVGYARSGCNVARDNFRDWLNSNVRMVVKKYNLKDPSRK